MKTPNTRAQILLLLLFCVSSLWQAQISKTATVKSAASMHPQKTAILSDDGTNPQAYIACPKGTYPNQCEGQNYCYPCLGCCICFNHEENKVEYCDSPENASCPTSLMIKKRLNCIILP